VRVHPDARWWLTECRALGRRYRWTRAILSNPRRLFWIELLFPLFHWRLMLELHVTRPIGRLAERAMRPYLGAMECVASMVGEAGEVAR